MPGVISKPVRGFTLIELVVTVSVLAILTALALPSLTDFMRRNAVASQGNEFLGSLRLARATAITRATFVSLCPTADATKASPTCATSNDYAKGYLVYTSKAAGKAFVADDELIKAAQATSGISLLAPATAQVMSFTPRGALTIGPTSLFLCAMTSGDTVGQSTVRANGRRFDIQASGRVGLVQLPGSATKATAQAYCQPAT